MKLKNKKTGEIIDIKDAFTESDNFPNHYIIRNEWEDAPEEPKANGYFIDIRYGKIEVKKDVNLPNSTRRNFQEIGLYFETEEEAERAVEKLKAWKRLKNKGFRFTEWYSSGDTTNTIRIYAEFPDAKLGPIAGLDLNLLFGGEE